MYGEYIGNSYVYYCDGKWIVEDDYGFAPYETYAEAKQAAEEEEL